MYSVIATIAIIAILLVVYKLKALLCQCVVNEESKYLLKQYHENNEKLLSVLSFVLFLAIIGICMHKSYENIEREPSLIVVELILIGFLILYFILNVVSNYKTKIALIDTGLRVRGRKINWKMISSIRRKGDKMIICCDLDNRCKLKKHEFIVVNYNEEVYELIKNQIA